MEEDHAFRVDKTTISSVTFVLFHSEVFWGNVKIESLGLLQSTCKEFKNAILDKDHADGTKYSRENKKRKRDQGPLPVIQNPPKTLGDYTSITSTLEYAVIHIMKGNPNVRKTELSVKEACLRFALSASRIHDFCTKLSPECKYFYHATCSSNFKEYHCILFVDAVKMAMERKGGMTTVAKLKAQSKTRRERTKSAKINEGLDLLQKNTDIFNRMEQGISLSLGKMKETKPPNYQNKKLLLKTLRHDMINVESRIAEYRTVLQNPRLRRVQYTVNQVHKLVTQYCNPLMTRYDLYASFSSYMTRYAEALL